VQEVTAMARLSESKEEAFQRLATKRTNAVLERIRVLGHCSNPQLYDYTQDDVRKIFQAIEKELRVVKVRFQNSSKSEFRL
jgi:histidinol phosphatase-like PHP family hydrolase